MLTNVLSEDMSALNGMTTETISLVVGVSIGSCLAMVIAVWFSWSTAICSLGLSPIILIGIYGVSRL